MPRPPTPPVRTALEDLPFGLARAMLSFRRFNDQTLRMVGLESLAPGLASVVHALEELGECPVNRLVERTHLPNSTLTGLLDELEDKGYIHRTRDPEDKRSRRIGLTAQGLRLCNLLQGRHRMVMDIFRRVLSDTERAELNRLLDKVTAGMRAHVAESGKPSPSPAKARKARRAR